jgi:hypothetical protein
MRILPWLFSLATAVWFGVMAYRARRSWLLWALGGALFALVTTTMIEGVGKAAFIPLSDEAVVMFRIKLAAVSAFNVVFLGWLLTLSLQRRKLVYWRQSRNSAQPKKGKNVESTLSRPRRAETQLVHCPAPARAK